MTAFCLGYTIRRKWSIVLLDPQSGAIGKEVEKIFESVKINKTELMRVDNLKLNNEYLNKTCEVWNSE